MLRSSLFLLVVVVVLVAGCGTAAAPPPTSRHTAADGWSDLPAVPADAPQERWRVPLPEGSVWTVSPDGTVLLVARGDGTATTVARLDPATGAVLWQAAAPGAAPSTLTVHRGRTPTVVLTTGTAGGPPRSAVTLLDLDGGRVQRTAPAGELGTVALLTDDVLVLTGLGGVDDPVTTAGLDRATGRQLWANRSFPSAEGNGLLVSDENDRTRLGTDARTGRAVWRVPRPGFTDALVLPGAVVVTGPAAMDPASLEDRLRDAAGLGPAGAGGSGTVTVLDPATGRARWTTPNALDRIDSSTDVAATADGGLLVASGDESPGTVVLDATTGAVRWRAPRIVADVSVRVGGTGYAIALPRFSSPAPLNRVLVLDAATGTEVARLDDLEDRTADVAGGALYLETDGTVTALALPDLDELWSVDTGAVDRISSIPDGFAALVPTTGFSGDLVGYVGGEN